MEDEEINIKKELFQNEIVNKEYNIDEFTEYVQQKTGKNIVILTKNQRKSYRFIDKAETLC